MANPVESLKGWAESFRADVEAMKAVLESTGSDADARKLAAGALSYQVLRLDLVPDHNPGIGVLDDLMVLRTCAALITSHKLGDLASSAEVAIGRMSNQADDVASFLGPELHPRFRNHCAKLADAMVRGRSAQMLMTDAAARSALYREIDDEMKKLFPISLGDPSEAELRLRSFLTSKLA